MGVSWIQIDFYVHGAILDLCLGQEEKREKMFVSRSLLFRFLGSSEVFLYTYFFFFFFFFSLLHFVRFRKFSKNNCLFHTDPIKYNLIHIESVIVRLQIKKRKKFISKK